MKRRLKLMGMMLLMLSAGSGAKDLGTWGNVFEPAEQDMLAFIQNRLKGMEQTGELDRLRQEATERVKEHAVRPTPVEGLTKAKEYRSFAWDPTFTVKETITDMQGNVIARKGDTVNPLDKVPFSQVLFFIDGDDKEQVNWTRQQLAGAWHQWCVENQIQPMAPEKRDEAFPLYLVRLIRNRMEEMNAWR